ncbi:MAG: LytTR family DNA-binding domain-containing protein [Saprospiraceae bacterium]
MKFQEILAIPLLKGHIAFRHIEDILYIKSDDTICHLYLTENEKLVSPRPLSFYKNLLEEQYLFIAFSQSLIIQFKHIDNYDNSNQEIILKNGVKLPISRRGASNFKLLISRNSILGKSSTNKKGDIL